MIDSMVAKRRSLKILGSDTDRSSDVALYCSELLDLNLHEDDDFVLHPVGRGLEDDLLCPNSDFALQLSISFPSLVRLTICHNIDGFHWELDFHAMTEGLPKLEALTLCGLELFPSPSCRTRFGRLSQT